VILSDINGLYTADPRKDEGATLIPCVYEITPEILALAGAAGSSLGTGGMQTKLHAAQIATASGAEMIIASGEDPDILYDIANGKAVGTRFFPKKEA
jgi:glutamate 5-kinase